MTTTQSENPNEKVAHPRWYNGHPSGIETIELIEHLPCNLANAVKYIWRCGLKATETPLRDLKSASWYTVRESERVEFFELEDMPPLKTDVVWRALARKILNFMPESPSNTLCDYLDALLRNDFSGMLVALDEAILALEASGS